LKEIIDLIDKYWKFDEDQQPLSSWHDKQELLQIISNRLEKLVSQKTADTEEILSAVKDTISDGQLMSMEESTEKELQKHYDKTLTVPLIVGLINNIEQYYPADVFVSGAGAMARHVLKLFKQELILACKIEDSRFSG